MRLINIGTLLLEEFVGSATPPYAILSHTWGEEEVSLQQFLQPELHKKKLGYQKIERACAQAAKSGFQYIWVDTCCIDKTSSTELTEAINSMFRWYQDAKKCFAYLADVKPSRSMKDMDSSFESSRWFTRGWTLQELLAPTNLVFLASDWSRLATRHNLAPRISARTGIQEQYLLDPQTFGRAAHNMQRHRAQLIRSASVAERMCWASTRQTTRVEDIAYCLLGLFDVHMPLIYGEGENAFQRLQEELLRRTFDPTILVWDIDSHLYASLEVLGSESFSIKDLVYLIHPWTELPWYSGQGLRPSSYNQLSRLCLAETPANFAGSRDYVVCNNAIVQHSVTNKGLHVMLPISEGLGQYAILPCRWKYDLRYLIALPIQLQNDGTYVRSEAPPKLLAHQAWHRWPWKEVIFSIRGNAYVDGDPAMRPVISLGNIPPELQVVSANGGSTWNDGHKFTWMWNTLESLHHSRLFPAFILRSKITNSNYAVVLPKGRLAGTGGELIPIPDKIDPTPASVLRFYHNLMPNHTDLSNFVFYMSVWPEDYFRSDLWILHIYESSDRRLIGFTKIMSKSQRLWHSKWKPFVWSFLPIIFPYTNILVLILGSLINTIVVTFLIRYVSGAEIIVSQVPKATSTAVFVYRLLPFLTLPFPELASFIRRQRSLIAGFIACTFQIFVSLHNEAQIEISALRKFFTCFWLLAGLHGPIESVSIPVYVLVMLSIVVITIDDSNYVVPGISF
ncbi:HET-domain-containing protein [Polyplosphaeria fusca]|uniref:HET-domain-containing protein n=1 Tax=Polyplosphaeria fusca TaxID=682080 RepID=A0A9P4R8C3_9PLEO|nr:HET-domain-containing protein [Polyplosphaeria fusca]